MRASPILLMLCMTSGIALAGCVEDPATTSDDALADGHADGDMMAMNHDFKVEMRGCSEGGGVSLYAMDPDGEPGPADPFIKENIMDDTGDPMIGSYFVPITTGGANGIWHISVACDSYTFGGEERGAFNMGWVGIRVQPPPWDDSGIARQFFVADFSVMDVDIVKALQDGTGAHTSRMLDNEITFATPGAMGVMHTLLDDEDHGVFETHAQMVEYRPLVVEPIRFWMYVSADGSHHHAGEGVPEGSLFRAVSFDLANSGEGTQWVAEDGSAWLSHTRTDAHGAVPAATGNTGAVLYEGFDRTMTVGPSPELYFNSTWLH